MKKKALVVFSLVVVAAPAVAGQKGFNLPPFINILEMISAIIGGVTTLASTIAPFIHTTKKLETPNKYKSLLNRLSYVPLGALRNGKQ